MKNGISLKILTQKKLPMTKQFGRPCVKLFILDKCRSSENITYRE